MNNIKETTKEIVKRIKESEEEKYKEYNVELEIETPTVIEFYIENLKKIRFKTLTYDMIEMREIYLIGKRYTGFTNSTNQAICIFAKNHFFKYIMKQPISNLNNLYPYQEMCVTQTTYHEIRHVLQQKHQYTMPIYDSFCSNYFSNNENPKYISDKDFHNSLYNEIDAELYAATESKNCFKGDEKVEKYFQNLIGYYTIQKNTYDFEEHLEKYQQNRENIGFQNKISHMESFIWNNDGSFKRPRDIYNSKDFLNTPMYYMDFEKFLARVISSNAYISRLNMNIIKTDEAEFICDSIEFNNKIITEEIQKLTDLYNNQAIADSYFEFAIQTLNNRIKKYEKTMQEIISLYNLTNRKKQKM